MPVWSRVDPVATVAQIAGVDAYGLIAQILQRVETVRRNRRECQQLAQQVETVGDLLPQVQREHPEMQRVLGKLEATLREACVLVSACQGSSYIRRFLRSGKHAEEFRRVREKLDFYLQIFPVIGHIDTTRRLVRIINEVGSPQTQNMPRSSSNRSGRASHRSIANEDYSLERPQARTEPFAVRRDETTNARSRGDDTVPTRSDTAHQLTHSTHHGLIHAGFSVFELSQLAKATRNFSNEFKIGEGGFGRVYKGRLQGLPVAIKRCFVESNPERLCDFENEIKFIPKLQHRNIVKLQGYCVEGKERILVYEYMSKKSLDKFIFGPRGGGSLNWDMLYKIIGGIAQGVVYLHLHSGLNIIHRDLKPSNILLDNDMNPKISDFGTARTCHPDLIQKVDVVTGTRGYMAPEYANKGTFSGKTDVFSFGSLLLEILTGKRNGTSYSYGNSKNLTLHEYAWNLMFVEKELTKLIHPSLCDEIVEELPPRRRCLDSQIRRCAHVALLCVQEDPPDRPSMWDVVLMLNAGSPNDLPNPKKPPRLYGSVPRFGDWLKMKDDEREWYTKTAVSVVTR